MTRRVIGPNGLSLPMPDTVAEGLVVSRKGRYSYDDTPEPTSKPARADSKADWVAYAVEQGADPDEAEASTKAELVENYG